MKPCINNTMNDENFHDTHHSSWCRVKEPTKASHLVCAYQMCPLNKLCYCGHKNVHLKTSCGLQKVEKVEYLPSFPFNKKYVNKGFTKDEY